MTIKKSRFRLHTAFLCLGAALAISCGGGGSGSNSSTTQNISVSVLPPSATVAPNGTQLFTATVTGSSNTNVTWSAGGVPGGSTAFGTISAAGLYTAPAVPPNPSNVKIEATSAADASKIGSAIADILVHHINQDFQNPPIKLGTSGGNANDKNTVKGLTSCCSGTLGALISRGGDLYILSNNHVLAKSDQGTIGDPISQPGLANTRCGQDSNTTVANLSQFAKLSDQKVDAAMAKIIAGEVDSSGAILDLAGPGNPAPPSATVGVALMNQAVAKSGDATGVTCSIINAIHGSFQVTYAPACQSTTGNFTVTFNNQIAINASTFSNSGDSGSLIVAADTSRPLALIYAGSSGGTVANPIQDVLSALADPNTMEVPQFVGTLDHPVVCPIASQSQVVARKKAIILPSAETARAVSVQRRYRAELMQDSAIADVNIGESEDNPAEAAVVISLRGQPRLPIPAQLDGLRTRIVPALPPMSTAASLHAAMSDAFKPIAEQEITRVIAVKEAEADNLMRNPAIFGVGVGASSDSPGEAALVIFVEEGKTVPIPPVVDGARTKVIVSDRFRAFDWGTRTRNSCSAPHDFRAADWVGRGTRRAPGTLSKISR